MRWSNGAKPAARLIRVPIGGSTDEVMKERILELVKYRELVRNLVTRDIKLRYRNSVLGLIWCLGNPSDAHRFQELVVVRAQPNGDCHEAIAKAI